MNTISNPEAYKTLSNKYITVYPYDSSNDTILGNWRTYNNLKYGYGDSILEVSKIIEEKTENWNGKIINYAYSEWPFFAYGGIEDNDNSSADMFALACTYGGPHNTRGFRVCLTFEE